MIEKIRIKETGEEFPLGAGGGSPTGVEIAYAELKQLRDNSQLVIGTNYIITDYQCTTITQNTTSAGHQFDIIVVADSVNTLNENARARKHEGDEYFANSNLAAWELKYSLDNDTTKFDWADEVNGKGVIYYMKDEWNNEVPYDFKNIIYQVKSGFTYSQWGKEYQLSRDTTLDTVINDTQFYGYRSDSTIVGNDLEYLLVVDEPVTTSSTLYKPDGTEYTFGGSIKSVSEDSYECYTFSILEDKWVDNSTSLSGTLILSYNNSISKYTIISYNSVKQLLNKIIFKGNSNSNTFGDGCYNNTFGDKCCNNTFGYNCHDNTFGNRCRNNTFGDDYYNNTFGDGCYNNTFGYNCTNNTFGVDCNDNIFGDYCLNNTFGNGTHNTIFGNNCINNTFGYNCHDNTFGNRCRNNTFNTYCENNKIGNDVTNCYLNYIEMITFGEHIHNVKISTDSNYHKNMVIMNRVNFDGETQLDLSNAIGAGTEGAPIIIERVSSDTVIAHQLKADFTRFGEYTKDNGNTWESIE